MRKGFDNSTSPHWHADASELTSSWHSTLSKVKLTLTIFIRPPRAGLRGHTYRLLQGPSRLRRRSGENSVWVVTFWNRLPAHLVLSPSVSIFRKQLDRQRSEIFTSAPVYFCPHSLTIFSKLLPQAIYVFH